jgi:hypothetical protein
MWADVESEVDCLNPLFGASKSLSLSSGSLMRFARPARSTMKRRAGRWMKLLARF